MSNAGKTANTTLLIVQIFLLRFKIKPDFNNIMYYSYEVK